MSTDFVLEIVKRKFPDATETQQVNAAQLARDKAMQGGGGISQLYVDSSVAAEIVIGEAMTEVMAAAKAKGLTDVTGPELAKLEAQRLCFGKAGAQTPLLHRGQYVKKYGSADYEAAMKLWGASATDLTPRNNPFAKPIRKAMKAARTGTLEATPFNMTFNADQVKQPKPPKLTREEKNSNPFMRGSPSWNLTAQGKLVRDNYPLAQRMAAQAGVKLP